MSKNDVEKLIEALSKGKKVRRKDGTDKILTSVPVIKIEYNDGTYEYCEGDEGYFYDGVKVKLKENINNIKIVGSSSYKTYDVSYYYFNPQCNRCFAKLTNGNITDYTPSLVDFYWNEYEIIDETKENNILKVTMEDVYAKFGRIVEIVK